MRFKRTVENVPTSKVKGVFIGMNEVKGEAEVKVKVEREAEVEKKRKKPCFSHEASRSQFQNVHPIFHAPAPRPRWVTTVRTVVYCPDFGKCLS